MAGFIQIRRTGHFHWFNEAESGLLALRLMCLPYKASPARIAPRPRLFGYFDERVIPKVSSFQLTRSTRLRLAHRIERMGLSVQSVESAAYDPKEVLHRTLSSATRIIAIGGSARRRACRNL